MVSNTTKKHRSHWNCNKHFGKASIANKTFLRSLSLAKNDLLSCFGDEHVSVQFPEAFEHRQSKTNSFSTMFHFQSLVILLTIFLLSDQTSQKRFKASSIVVDLFLGNKMGRFREIWFYSMLQLFFLCSFQKKSSSCHDRKIKRIMFITLIQFYMLCH